MITTFTGALTDLNITIENFSDQALRFSMVYSTIAVASYSADALAFVSVDMLDDFGLFELQALFSTPTDDLSTGSSSLFGSVDLVLLGGEHNWISGFVDSAGSTALTIPLPATLLLFSSGLIGLIGVAQKSRINPRYRIYGFSVKN